MSVQEHSDWRPLSLVKQPNRTLTYNLPANGEVFSRLRLEFSCIKAAETFQSLTIFAETHDKTICYNEDSRYPGYYVPVYRSWFYDMDFDLSVGDQPLGSWDYVGVVERYVIVIEFQVEIKGRYALWYQ